MDEAPFDWKRGPRQDFSLGADCGVYALFLRPGANLPIIEPGREGLVYIGMTGANGGFAQRCHFRGKTGTHSPRRSLAALLMDMLDLKPLPKRGNSTEVKLAVASERRLDRWMHDNLLVAYEICPDPIGRETELVSRLAPPLNLTKCVQSAAHRSISAARAEVRRRVVSISSAKQGIAGEGMARSQRMDRQIRASSCSSHLPEGRCESAEMIAERYSLSPKSFRSRLRKQVFWYTKPMRWEFPVGSREWLDMIAVAESMTRQ